MAASISALKHRISLSVEASGKRMDASHKNMQTTRELVASSRELMDDVRQPGRNRPADPTPVISNSANFNRLAAIELRRLAKRAPMIAPELLSIADKLIDEADCLSPAR